MRPTRRPAGVVHCSNPGHAVRSYPAEQNDRLEGERVEARVMEVTFPATRHERADQEATMFRTSSLFMGLALSPLSGCWWELAPDGPDDSGGCEDRSCQTEVIDIWPEDGEADVYHRASIEVLLDDPEPWMTESVSLEGPDGHVEGLCEAVVSGALSGSVQRC